MDKIRIYIALLFCLTLSFIPPVLAQDTSGSDSNRYNTLYSYECMGNITSLSRNGLLDDWSGTGDSPLYRRKKVDIYKSEITHQEPAGAGARDKILKYEKDRASKLREELDHDKHKKHKL